MNCPTCGSAMIHFKNPDRDICPTPERHKVSTTLGRKVGGRAGTSQVQRKARIEIRKKEREDKDKKGKK